MSNLQINVSRVTTNNIQKDFFNSNNIGYKLSPAAVNVLSRMAESRGHDVRGKWSKIFEGKLSKLTDMKSLEKALARDPFLRADAERMLGTKLNLGFNHSDGKIGAQWSGKQITEFNNKDLGTHSIAISNPHLNPSRITDVSDYLNASPAERTMQRIMENVTMSLEKMIPASTVVKAAQTSTAPATTSPTTTNPSATSGTSSAASTQAPSGATASSQDFSFIHDPKMSIEDKMLMFFAIINSKMNKEIEDLMAKQDPNNKAAAEAPKKKSKGPFGFIADAVKSVAKVALPVVAGVVGGPVAAAVASKIAPPLVDAVGGLVSGAVGGGASKPAAAGAAAPAETPEILQAKMQKLQNQLQQFTQMISNLMKGQHDTKMSFINNMRG